jgi:hypothetical protein
MPSRALHTWLDAVDAVLAADAARAVDVALAAVAVLAVLAVLADDPFPEDEPQPVNERAAHPQTIRVTDASMVRPFHIAAIAPTLARADEHFITRSG